MSILSIRRIIEEMKPSVVFCGHIHEAKGKDQINRTLVVNPRPARYGDYAEAFFNNDVTIKFSSLQWWGNV